MGVLRTNVQCGFLLHLQEGGLLADINGDGVLDHVQAVGAKNGERTVISRSMEVLRPCWAVATSGVPVREQLFNASICHHSPFNLFQHGEFYRSIGQSANASSFEVVTPIFIPRSDGHKHRHRKGISRILSRVARAWCRLRMATFDGCGMVEPSFAFRHDGRQKCISISRSSCYTYTCSDVDDFSNEGLSDLIVVTSNGVYGFVQRRQPGALFFSTLVGCLLLVMGVIFVTQYLNSIKGKPRSSP
ncbi:protein SHI RELATED SEQUENCE 1-like isoform X1 [Hibiscus syriacus]|uniref:Protein SHI RELATED SEQUENCE 1-like isoform X1 n=1 Tax=Hibiscus syriacus TaxID=106335 RepID=A0A6A2XHZ6_HIBSY|nr:protein SHI RELATED SEQUENCE 1-like isoform X1 [Hibiscus syriacus]